jgi:hypothetical protein
MTPIAHRDLAQLGGRLSILAPQRRDHARLEDLLRRLGERRPARIRSG